MQLSSTGWELPYEITLTWKIFVVVVVLVFYVSPTAKVRHELGFKFHPKDCRSKGLVCCLFLFNIPVNNFSVILGQNHCFLGVYQYFGNLKVSCSRTLYGGRGIGTLDLSLKSPKL